MLELVLLAIFFGIFIGLDINPLDEIRKLINKKKLSEVILNE